MAPLVFISYASADHDLARVILEDLESDGMSCWMASRDILVSEDYVRMIPQSIADARVLLLVLSESSLASVHVYREVHLATDDKKPILPVRIDPIKSVEGQLKFSLAGTQWLDATPRLQPALPRIRSEVRRLLANTGVIVKPVRRAPFEETLASAFAWTLVAAVTGLTIEVIRTYWINLVPWPEILLQVARHPLTLLAALIVPFLALGTQLALHRRVRSIFTLDALFATAPKAAAGRTLFAFALLAILALAVALGPRAILLTKTEHGPDAERGTAFGRFGECTRLYYEVSKQYYEATVQIGRFNPPGDYVIQFNLEYIEPDSVNFCDVWAAPHLIEGAPLSFEDKSGVILPPNRIRTVELRRPKDAFGKATRVILTLKHPRSSPPQMRVEGIASVGRAGQWMAASKRLPIVASDWGR